MEKRRFIDLTRPDPLMIELNIAVLILFLAHMHSRYHESSKTQKKLFFVKIAQKSYILFSETVSMLIWNACFSYYHLETEKKLFHHFKRLKSSCIVWCCCLGVLEDSWYRLCIWAKKSPKTAILNSIMSGFDVLKTVKRIFFHFTIKLWEETFRMKSFTASGDKTRLL